MSNELEKAEKDLQEARQLSWRRTLANIPRPDYDTPREPAAPPTDPFAPTATASNSLLVEGQREGTASVHAEARCAVPKSLENLGVLTPEVSAASSDSSTDGSVPSSTSSISSSSPIEPVQPPSNHKTKLPPPIAPPPKPFDYNHFYPWDPTLPTGAQNPRLNIPPPDQAELARRNRRFNRVHGFRNHRP